MKKILCIIAIVAISATSVFAQRPVKLSIVSSQGGPYDKADIVVFTKGDMPAVHRIDRSGKATLENVMNMDTLGVMIRNKVYEFPMNGTDQLEITVTKRGKIVDVIRNGRDIANTGYTKVPRDVYPYDVKVATMSNPDMYNSLAEYLEGRIAGLVIEGGPGFYQAYLNGTTPLVVVDGIRMRSFNAANNLINPSDIESITVDRNGALYGLAGMNGVLIITLK